MNECVLFYFSLHLDPLSPITQRYLARVYAFANSTTILVDLETKFAVASTRRWTPAHLVALFLRTEVVLVTATAAVDESLARAGLAVEEPAREIRKTYARDGRQLAQRRQSRCLG